MAISQDGHAAFCWAPCRPDSITFLSLVQGLTRAGKQVEEGGLGVSLWLHETLRIFYDRLINDEDRTWLTGLLSGMWIGLSLQSGPMPRFQVTLHYLFA